MNPILAILILGALGLLVFLVLHWASRDRADASETRAALEATQRDLRAERELTKKIERDAFDTLELDPHDALARMVLDRIRTGRYTPDQRKTH